MQQSLEAVQLEIERASEVVETGLEWSEVASESWRLSITDTRYGYGYGDTAIRRFSKNKDTSIRQVYIFLKI